VDNPDPQPAACEGRQVRPAPEPAASQFGAFTASQARAGGWTPSALRHAVRTSRIERLRPGVYAVPARPTGIRGADARTALIRAAAALALVNPRLPISHCAAAALMDLPLLEVPRRVCVTAPGGPRGRRAAVAGAHVHHGRLPALDRYRANRIPVTSPSRTVVDIAREHGVAAALVAADAALRQGLATASDLTAALAACAGWPAVRAAARAISLADPRAESPLESVSRLRIVDAGLPPPDPQPRIFDRAGRFLGRVDFYWDDCGVIGEADGLVKYDDDPTALRREKARQGRLEDCGLIAVRWGWADLADFAPAAARLHAAFARGQRPDRHPRDWIVRPTEMAAGPNRARAVF
jgi:hypothetical protein